MHPSPSVSAALNASLVLSEDMYWRFSAQEQFAVSSQRHVLSQHVPGEKATFENLKPKA